MEKSYKIKVPATSANLGPGFDCLGLALSIYNTFTVKKSDVLMISGCESKYANEKNLFYVAFKKTMEILNKKGSIAVDFNCDIPVSRGLGSSATLIVGGCRAANILYGNNKLSEDDIFQIATLIETHPDNTAPAVFKGLNACIESSKKSKLTNSNYYYQKKYKVSNKLHFSVLIPDFQVSTEEARELMPKFYEKEKVTVNISHSILMAEALRSGDFELLKTAKEDAIHEPFRKLLIKDYESIKKAVEKDSNAILLISGSGSTLLTISKKEQTFKLPKTKNIWKQIKVKAI